MGKIRVYELAKEAGMDSKAMTEKLKEMGYSIKSHSSSLEEHEAEDVRQKLGLVETQVERKRIQTKGKTTIIRRRTRAVPLEVSQPQEVPAEKKPEEEVSAPEAMVEEKPLEAVPSEEEIAAKTEKEALPLEEVPVKTEPGKKPEEAPETEAAAGEVPVAPKKLAETKEIESAEVETEEPPAKKAAKPKPEKSRKGLARVIKKSAIDIPQVEEEPKPKPKPKRAFKAKGKVPQVPVEPVGVEQKEAKEQEAPAKGKKGKRLVKFHPDTTVRDRLRKGPGKRKGRVEMDIEDIGEFGDRIPAGLRVGRGSRPGARKAKQLHEVEVAETKAIKKRIKVYEFISVADIAHRMGVRASEIIAKLMELGVMATVNQALDVDTASLVAADFGYEIEQGVTEEQTVLDLEEKESGGEEMARPPVVTVMGHVDHGKTSILDAIRKTDVAAGEAGGITQHIGAHYVRSTKGDVVFLDTPGHAAFTEMRSRGAKVTDVVVLVVAADDGVMDQTKEAINHARAAEVPIVVAVNKIDKDDANPDRVKRELAEFGLVPEEWGGDTIFCETSAKKNIGIEELLEQILLQAEILELKADPKRMARGRVVEAQLHKGRGPVATILVQQGTLQVGAAFVVGKHFGKVRSLFSDKGENVQEGGPSIPVEVQGLSGVPQAGDEFMVVPDEKFAKNVSSHRQLKSREAELAITSKISLDNLFDKLQEGEVKELRVILRADVQGTLEAFRNAIEELSTDEIRVKIIHDGAGTIVESDVLLAAASEALIIGFNVRPNTKVQDLAKTEKVDIRYYDVIYHAIDDIRKAMSGMLEPTFAEKVIGSAEVRETFTVPKVGTIAGSYVSEGKIIRNGKVRLLRDGVVVYTGSISSLRRFKDDAKEVLSGYECGIGVENFNDIKVGDVLEVFVVEEVSREL